MNLNGHNFIALTLLVPGASPNNGLDLTPAHTGSDVSISFNGGRGSLYNLDNGEVNGAWDPRIMQLALKFIF